MTQQISDFFKGLTSTTNAKPGYDYTPGQNDYRSVQCTPDNLESMLHSYDHDDMHNVIVFVKSQNRIAVKNVTTTLASGYTNAGDNASDLVCYTKTKMPNTKQLLVIGAAVVGGAYVYKKRRSK
jgi:hypothetical protein